MKWRCLVCGYIHEGETPPEVCPICGVDASNFEKMETESNTSLNEEKNDSQQLNSRDMIKKAINSITYGLFIITANYQNIDNGQTANTCFQITSEPVQIAIGINKNNYTHELIYNSGKFGISILDKSGHNLARNFGYRTGRGINKFDKIKTHRGKSGVLLINDVLATIEAEVTNKLDVGTHTLFIGKVTAAEILKNGEPMTYAYYRKTK